ncbi:MAG: aspartate kinase [FCB group bacterium]|jgi:aspartate kinase|nr:aspartate kinase [FCB group bacterium]
MSGITCKFGGTSLADASCIRQVEAIIRSNPERRFIVPSAPGKRNKEDRKITDLLYAWHGLIAQGLDPSQPAGIIGERFRELAADLGVKFNIESCLEEITMMGACADTPDYMASRGEYLNGLLMAEFLGATFVDPAECIKFDLEGAIDPVTYELLGQRLSGDGMFVVPGFYGSMPDGSIRTFSRGGSDVTGAIVARAAGSEIYENWTDVSGFLMADPNIVENPKRIDEVTYRELRELSYMGAKVLHDEVIFPIRSCGIRINVRNTWEPDNPGTMIVPSRVAQDPVCGIAGRGGFTMLIVEKALMNREVGFGRRILQIFEEHGVGFEHMPSGIDTLSVIVNDAELASHGPSIVRAIERNCEPDRLTLTSGLALIATVGQGMSGRIGMAARLCSALANRRINIRVIDQGASENNIIVGVEETDLEDTVRAIYAEFAE